MLLLTLLLGALLNPCHGLNNGLALTPPMGWMSWGRNDCAHATDCNQYPNKCITANYIKRSADRLVNDGYRDAGYNYLLIDFCWMENTRTYDGHLVADRGRFPLGMKDVADYVHSKGLKLGVYYGNYTCATDFMNIEKLTVDTLVQWDVDYIKLDACLGSSFTTMEEGNKSFGTLLKNVGRDIVYSCTSAYYQEYALSTLPNYAFFAEHCNMWRSYHNVEKSWTSVRHIMDWYGDNQYRLAMHAGPGHWNDPDALVIGSPGLSEDQARVQMAIWAILAAPLLMDTDLDTMKPEFKKILLNRDIIDVNQDVLGKQGLRILQRSQIDVWRRELHDGSVAIAFVNRLESGGPHRATFSHSDLQLPNQLYAVKDLYQNDETRLLHETGQFDVQINPTGVKFYKFTLSTLEKPPSQTHKPGHVDMVKFMEEIRTLISNIAQVQDTRINKLESTVETSLKDMRYLITTKAPQDCSNNISNDSCKAKIDGLEFNMKSSFHDIIHQNKIVLQKIEHVHEHLINFS